MKNKWKLWESVKMNPMNIELNRNDLKEGSSSKAIEDLEPWDFNLSLETIASVDYITFTDGEEVNTLKHPSGLLGVARNGGKTLQQAEMLELFNRFKNAHYSMSADEYNENASFSAINRRAAKSDALEEELIRAIKLQSA